MGKFPGDIAHAFSRLTTIIAGQSMLLGGGFPCDGTDDEWKITGRDAIRTLKDGVLKLATAAGDEALPSGDITTSPRCATRSTTGSEAHRRPSACTSACARCG